MDTLVVIFFREGHNCDVYRQMVSVTHDLVVCLANENIILSICTVVVTWTFTKLKRPKTT